MEFFKKHPETLLVVLAIIFITIILGSFSWGIGTVLNAVNSSVNFSPSGGESPPFNLEGAAKLDLRGLYATGTATQAGPSM